VVLIAKRKLTIVMADDDPDDRMFVRAAFEGKPVEVRSVVDGQELMDYLLCKGEYRNSALFPRPDLIILDLNMPKMGGKEALAEIQADSCLKSIPVIILTTSQEECEVQKCYALGANTYIVKPLSFQKLVEIMHSLHLYWADVAQLPAHAIPPSCRETA
jgi:CheY-like chemotaxis protein